MSSKEILIVDNNVAQADQLMRVLEKGEYEVVTAVDGPDGLEAAKTIKPGVVVSAVSLPRLDGGQLCQAIKGDPELRNTPVVLMVRPHSHDDILAALEAGADDVLIGAPSEELLLACIKNLGARNGSVSAPNPLEIDVGGRKHQLRVEREQLARVLLSVLDSQAHDGGGNGGSAATGPEQELARLKEALLANLSYELLSPLATIKGYITSLRKNDDTPAHESIMNRLSENIDHMGDMIENLVYAADLQAGRIVLERQEVDIKGTIAESVSDEEARAENKGISIFYKLPSAPLMLGVDTRRLRRALRHLIDNSIKYSPEAGEVMVQAGKTQSDVVIKVSDQGPGFDADLQSDLFDNPDNPPGQSDPPTGLGVGLYIVKKIVQAHGGRIQVDSKPGSGCTIALYLPLNPSKR
ncbi:MAG TPA: hybrid sensor histidine kinase/response regulator [Candidatus Xenobia bacterium]|jgi:signal transduction histidine kinase